MNLSQISGATAMALLIAAAASPARAAEPFALTSAPASGARMRPLAAVLPDARWQQVEQSVDRALAWLARQQQASGAFPSIDSGQPGVTSLCVMAFLSRGHQPGVGPYGAQLNRAIDYVLSCQMPDGMFSYGVPEPQHEVWHASHTAAYNHAIAGLMLGEVYGQVTGPRAGQVKAAIGKAIQFTRQLQTIRPKPPRDEGGWRYLRMSTFTDSDLSVTAWQLMFLRSAKNAEFDVPPGSIENALGYVRRCFDPGAGTFSYGLNTGYGYYVDTRSMAGAGILALSLVGQHETDMARSAGDWLIAHPFRRFGETIGPADMFFYSTYYCSQGAAQLGGRYWERIYPAIADVLLSAQQSDGSWPPEVGLNSAMFGNKYSTAMAVLSLTPPYQLLPVYQR
jgi:hypothetical protein